MFPQKLSDIFHRERYSIGSLLLPRLVNKLFDNVTSIHLTNGSQIYSIPQHQQ